MDEEQQLIYNELISKYNFNIWQKAEIKLGLEKELNISIYAKPEFNDEQMCQIRVGLEDGLDVSWYSKS